MSQTGTSISMVLSVSSACLIALLFETPGLPLTQSPIEMVWPVGSFGFMYVALLPGGVRLATRDGSLGPPVQLSQPKLPGCVPL